MSVSPLPLPSIPDSKESAVAAIKALERYANLPALDRDATVTVIRHLSCTFEGLPLDSCDVQSLIPEAARLSRAVRGALQSAIALNLRQVTSRLSVPSVEFSFDGEGWIDDEGVAGMNWFLCFGDVRLSEASANDLFSDEAIDPDELESMCGALGLATRPEEGSEPEWLKESPDGKLLSAFTSAAWDFAYGSGPYDGRSWVVSADEIVPKG